MPADDGEMKNRNFSMVAMARPSRSMDPTAPTVPLRSGQWQYRSAPWRSSPGCSSCCGRRASSARGWWSARRVRSRSAVRFALACLCALLIVLVTRARFMGWKMAGHVAVVGLLLHGVYLGGVFWSIAEGLPAGVSALIAGLQPIVTACLVGALLGERVARLQWVGFAAGLVGIALVLWERLAIGGVGVAAVAPSFIALAAITAGALYQKRFCTDVPIWPAAVVQYAAATVLVGIGTLGSRTPTSSGRRR